MVKTTLPLPPFPNHYSFSWVNGIPSWGNRLSFTRAHSKLGTFLSQCVLVLGLVCGCFSAMYSNFKSSSSVCVLGLYKGNVHSNMNIIWPYLGWRMGGGGILRWRIIHHTLRIHPGMQ